MYIRSLIHRANFKDPRNLYVALTAPAIGFVAAKLLLNLLWTSDPTSSRPLIYRAPSKRLLTPREEEDIPYPPDALPGGRDIDTPLGNVRAYEWGPEDGRRVLFVHGISTPCIAMARIAKLLVRKGCRVMLFDLYGRGYSDTPDPETWRQDIQLFSAQMLAVLASSRLDWTASRFTLVGYSLGGGITTSFTAHYPHLVESLILIAPGGLLRPAMVSPSSKLLYSGFLPQWLVNYWVSKRLRVGDAKPNVPKMQTPKKVDVTRAIEEEVPSEDDSFNGQDSWSPIFEDRPRVSPATAVAWQVDAHPGFLPAFVSSIKHAPIHDGHARWRMIGKRCEQFRMSDDPEVKARGLEEGKVLILLGIQDVVITLNETYEDATATLGKDNVKILKLQGGHDLPIVNSDGCAKAMLDFWDSA